MKRVESNPIIVKEDIKPSSPNMKVDGVFNAGATIFNGKIILLLRIAESVICDDEKLIKVPILNDNDELEIITYNKEDSRYNFEDSRGISLKETGKTICLTSLSHLRIATSDDGINFTIDEKPTIWPEGKSERWGIEDPRISNIDDVFYINYTSVSRFGACTSLLKTTDFKNFDRMGIIFPPENKDVCIFPEKINGLYYAFHRPVPRAFGSPDIWTASSKDMINWGSHKHFLECNDEGTWDNGRIGGGAPSIKTDKGWLQIYHASDKQSIYSLGAFLTDLKDPTKLIGTVDEPLLRPEESYEIEGFFGNVVFTCGVTLIDDVLFIYYGAADDKICLVQEKVQNVLEKINYKK